MLTNPENAQSAEREPSTDELLVAAIGRANDVIVRLVEFDIGAEASAVYRQERDIEDDLHAGPSLDIDSSLDTITNNEAKKGVVYRGLKSLSRSFGFRQASDSAQQDSSTEGVGEVLSDASVVYGSSFNSARGLVYDLFNQKLLNGFQLESLNERMTLSRAVDQDTRINVAYEVDKGAVLKSAYYESISSFRTDGKPSAPNRRVKIKIDRHNRADGVDIIKLEIESVAALEQVIKDLTVFYNK